MKKISSFIIALLFSLSTFANGKVEMADALRGSGKIYVVVAVMALLFLALFIYLFTIDKKISKLEKK
jgi:uncharacterized membrane protein